MPPKQWQVCLIGFKQQNHLVILLQQVRLLAQHHNSLKE
jgi:hypothetical protein